MLICRGCSKKYLKQKTLTRQHNIICILNMTALNTVPCRSVVAPAVSASGARGALSTA